MTVPRLLCIFGAPGAGKDTVIAELGKHLSLVRIPRRTTKPNTRQEADGISFRFSTDAEFDRVESDMIYVQRHAGYRYGIERRFLHDRLAAAAGRQPLLMSNIEEALAIHAQDPTVLLAYLTAPTPEEAERRIRERPDDPLEIEKKVAGVQRNLARFSALSDVEKSKIHVVVNDTVDHAVSQILQLLSS